MFGFRASLLVLNEREVLNRVLFVGDTKYTYTNLRATKRKQEQQVGRGLL